MFLARNLRGASAAFIVGACALALGQSARADFIVLKGEQGSFAENVQFNMFPDDAGSTVTGDTNVTSTLVDFTSTTQILFAPSGGQARVEAIDQLPPGQSQVDITGGIAFSLNDPTLYFTRYGFNAFKGNGGTLTVDVFGIDSGGNLVSDSFTLDDNGDPIGIGNGENKYTVEASNGQLIRSVVITPNGTGAYQDLRQNRIDGIQAFVVPEPASLAMVGVGVLGVIGLGLKRRVK
jgi:PEP-CTERM motif